MPQTLTNSWKVKLGDKYQIIHDKYLHNIGNLSLSGDNTQLGNKSFEEKQRILEEQSRLKLNKYFINASTWGESEINRRANVIFEDAKLLWNYPEHLDLKLDFQNNDKEFYTLDDNIDVTNKKPIYFELLHEKYIITTWKDIYINLMKILVDFDWEVAKSLLIDDDLKGKFSTVPDNFRTPREIKDSYFIETNLSANTIMNYVKLICEKFELSGDDFIYAVK